MSVVCRDRANPHTRTYIRFEENGDNMTANLLITLLLSVCCIVAAAADSGRCYRIEPGTIAGIICADVLLTIVIVIITYQWASRRRQRNDSADEVYMNVRANCKT